MGDFLGFVLFWTFIMVLIGIALKIVAAVGQKKANEKAQEKTETQDIADE